MSSSSFFETLELRKRKFWQQCTECATHHNARLRRGVECEWPQDGVEDFFSHWSAVDRRGQMRFEKEEFWSISQRMGSYMKRRRWLESIYEAHLERARGRRQGKSLEQRRAEAQDQKAQQVYDRFFESEMKN